MTEILSYASILIALFVATVAVWQWHAFRGERAERDRRFRTIRDQLTELCRVSYKTEATTVRLEEQVITLRGEQEARGNVIANIRADALRQDAFDARMADVDAALVQLGDRIERSRVGQEHVDKKRGKRATRVA
jgi:hypothetical protein